MSKLSDFLKKMIRITNVLGVAEQKKLIESFPEPKDDIDRSYFHFKCKFENRSAINQFLLNLIGFWGSPFLLLLYIFNAITFHEKTETHSLIMINNSNKYGMLYNYQGMIPESLSEEFGELYTLNVKKYPKIQKGVFSWKAFGLWMKLVLRYPWTGYLNISCLIHIMSLNRIIRIYQPSAIVNARVESNYVSSFLTSFCESLDLEYILFMHGELFVNKDASFLHFSRIYIWDEHYQKIFDWARCKPGRYVTFTPGILKRSLAKAGDVKAKYFATYVMTGNEDRNYVENVNGICNVLKQLTDLGKAINIRPHPRWSNIEEIKRLSEERNIHLDDPMSVSVDESLNSSEYIIGSFSTVILQAYYAGKKVVLDDVSNPEFYKKLDDLKYIMCSKEHTLLSDLIRVVKSENGKV